VPDISLSNGENRSFLSCTYQKLFKNYPPAFFFGMGSSSISSCSIYKTITASTPFIEADLNLIPAQISIFINA
jgi:hypothetical protein